MATQSNRSNKKASNEGKGIRKSSSQVAGNKDMKLPENNVDKAYSDKGKTDKKPEDTDRIQNTSTSNEIQDVDDEIDRGDEKTENLEKDDELDSRGY